MRNSNTRTIALTAILAAVIIVLQALTSVIKFGTVNPSLVLLPVTIGGILGNPKISSFLGGFVGLVVFVMCVFALDPGGYILFNTNGLLTFLVCMVKGIVSGLVSGLVYKYCKIGKDKIAVNSILPAIVTPVLNTGIFCLFMFFGFRNVLDSWTPAGTDVFTFVITGLVGINFIVELILNVVLCPVIAPRLQKSVRKI